MHFHVNSRVFVIVFCVVGVTDNGFCQSLLLTSSEITLEALAGHQADTRVWQSGSLVEGIEICDGSYQSTADGNGTTWESAFILSNRELGVPVPGTNECDIYVDEAAGVDVNVTVVQTGNGGVTINVDGSVGTEAITKQNVEFIHGIAQIESSHEASMSVSAIGASYLELEPDITSDFSPTIAHYLELIVNNQPKLALSHVGGSLVVIDENGNPLFPEANGKFYLPVNNGDSVYVDGWTMAKNYLSGSQAGDGIDGIALDEHFRLNIVEEIP